MRNHLVNDRFWNDSFVEELNSEQKLLFLYLLTCPVNNYLGIFEIGISTISFQTSIPKDNIKKYIEFLSKNKKIFYKDGWICINNFNKYNKLNPITQKNVDEQLKIIPKNILSYFEEIKQSLPKDCLRIVEGLPNPPLNSNIINSNVLNSNNILDSINTVMNRFYEINPGLNFGNKTQRDAAEFLLKRFKGDLSGMIDWYISRMSDKYCPVATTPLAFKEKLGDIKIYAEKLKNNQIVTNLGNV
jgi:hypothetical protein